MTETDIEKYVKSLEPKIFGLDVLDKIQVRELGGGLHHKNYRIHFGEPTSDAYSFVLRIPASQFDFKDLENELWYIRQLQSHGIPQFVHFSESGPNGYPALISKFASGHHIEFAKLSAQQIAEFAKTLASIHSLKNDHFSAGKAEQPARNGCYRDYAQFTLAERIEKPYDAVKNFVEHDTVMLASAKATLSELLKGAEPGWNSADFRLCHGDIGATNVIWNDNTPTFIDWDDARYGDPADDIAYVYAINELGPDWQNSFMSEYILHSDDQALQSRILPYILKNRLFDVVWALGKIKEAQDKSSLVIVSEYEYRTMYDSRLAGLAGFLKTL